MNQERGTEQLEIEQNFEPKVDKLEAIKILENERKQRIVTASEEIKTICEKYKVVLQPIVTIVNNQLYTEVQLASTE